VLTQEAYDIKFKEWVEAIEFLLSKRDKGIDEATTKDVKLSFEEKAESNKLQELNYFWINSCEMYNPSAWKKMLDKNIACTYGPQEYGDKLNRLQIGDIVLLYLSGYGIIASGKVTRTMKESTTPLTIPNPKKDDQEYTIGVEWNIKGNENKYISPSEIKKIGHNIFIPTVMKLNMVKKFKKNL